MTHRSPITLCISPEKEGGYSVTVAEYPIFSQGQTIEEALANIKEAMECHFGTLEPSHDVATDGA